MAISRVGKALGRNELVGSSSTRRNVSQISQLKQRTTQARASIQSSQSTTTTNPASESILDTQETYTPNSSDTYAQSTQSNKSNMVSEKKVKPFEKALFASSQISNYHSQSGSISSEISQLEAKQASDRTGQVRAELAQKRAKAHFVNAAKNFWTERESKWIERQAYSTGDVDNPYSAYKVEMYRSQSAGLEKTMDAWLQKSDSSGYARANIAQLRAQLNLVDAAEKFWIGENEFWKQENNSQYKAEDNDIVEKIYSGIEALQRRYEAVIMAESNEDGLGLFTELEKLKGELNQYRLNNNTYSGYTPYVGTVNPFEEKALASFKTEFYDSQNIGLLNLRDQWTAVNDSTGMAQSQLEKIDKQRKSISEASKFWQEQEQFWEDIGEAGQLRGQSPETLHRIEVLLGQMTGFENLMDQWLSQGPMDTAEQERFVENQINQHKTSINNIKAELRSLHENY